MKEKKSIKEQQRRNFNTLKINTNVKSRNFQKKLHVFTILHKQNLANTLKSYAMCNLREKYKILQIVKIMQQKQISKGINNNRKSITLSQCLKVFNQKTSTGPVYVCTVCLQTWFRTSVQDVANCCRCLPLLPCICVFHINIIIYKGIPTYDMPGY